MARKERQHVGRSPWTVRFRTGVSRLPRNAEAVKYQYVNDLLYDYMPLCSRMTLRTQKTPRKQEQLVYLLWKAV